MKNNKTILKELKEQLVHHFGNNIKDVILFGSHASGKASEHSDYDIIVIIKNDYDWKYKDKIFHVVYDIELEYEIIIDLKIISLNELNNTLRGKQPLFLNAIKQGIYA
jgi:predicted nucleotidyltransferase